MPKISFSLDADPRKGMPYVARITLDADQRLARDFYQLARDWGRKRVIVSGTVTIPEGAVIEVRTGGSWKNDYRSFYLSRADGLWLLGAHDDAATKQAIRQYLAGTAPAPEPLASRPEWKAEADEPLPVNG